MRGCLPTSKPFNFEYLCGASGPGYIYIYICSSLECQNQPCKEHAFAPANLPFKSAGRVVPECLTTPLSTEAVDAAQLKRRMPQEAWQEKAWKEGCRGNAATSSTRKERVPTIEESIGMNLHDRHPKSAVREFLQRYAGRDLTRDDSYYTVAEGHSGFQAKLHVAVWSNHVFQGEISGTRKKAEISAAACFLKDPAVVEAARLLPPPLKVIKFWTKFNEAGDQTIPGKRRRFDPNDIWHQYNEQREQGGQMAGWHGQC